MSRVANSRAGELGGVYFTPLKSHEQTEFIAGRMPMTQYLDYVQRVADSEISRDREAEVAEQKRLYNISRWLMVGGAAVIVATYLVAGAIFLLNSHTQIGLWTIVTGVGIGLIAAIRMGLLVHRSK